MNALAGVRGPRRAQAAALAAVLVAVAVVRSVATASPYVRAGLGAAPVDVDTSAIDARIVLVGDAGKPRLDRPDPVLAALGEAAWRLPRRTWVVFLGDNAYPSGIPPHGDRHRNRAERRLRAQVDAVVPSGANVVFVPGNHDHGGGRGTLKHEVDFLSGLGYPSLRALPAGGCPGPDVVDAASRLRLVVLDTEWWLQDPARRVPADSSCACIDEAGILAALDDAIRTAGDRRVVVVAHHPLATHGPHGGRFTLRQHVFPLTELRRWAWLPLPLIGSLYPIARRSGISDQDFSGRANRHMRDSLGRVLRNRPVLVYASGHEHSLQVLEYPGARVHVVSGAGTLTRPESVGHADDTLLSAGEPGFVQLDLLRDGSARLEVVTVRKDGRTERPLSLRLPPP